MGFKTKLEGSEERMLGETAALGWGFGPESWCGGSGPHFSKAMLAVAASSILEPGHHPSLGLCWSSISWKPYLSLVASFEDRNFMKLDKYLAQLTVTLDVRSSFKNHVISI